MDDLYICRRIAEIEGFTVSSNIKAGCGGAWASIYDKDCYGAFNPLKDDALCFELMVSHGVAVFHKYENDILICWAEHSDGSGAIGKPLFAPAGSDLQAVKQCACLAIIEANK